MRGVTRVTPLILSADVHDHGLRTLRLDFEGGDQRIFCVHNGVVGRPLQLEANGELHQRCSIVCDDLLALKNRMPPLGISFNHLAGVRAGRGEIRVTDFGRFGGAPWRG
jgi:hypothetical protein